MKYITQAFYVSFLEVMVAALWVYAPNARPMAISRLTLKEVQLSRIENRNPISRYIYILIFYIYFKFI
jgi:hypothetical protein